jgi:transaldolase/glucose-6-phosphate isomerase
VRLDLPADLRRDVDALLADWESGAKVARLWDGDATLWTGSGEERWLGWLAVERERVRVDEWRRLRAQARAAGLDHVMVLGMGGSSLCPEVLGVPILDSTDPVEVLTREREVPLGSTLFIVSSKSGTTLETDMFMRHFVHRVAGEVGPERAGERFVAITDPGSALEEEARDRGFRAVVPGVPAIGGRYSALSAFGMVPAAIAGLDVGELLARGRRMAEQCGPSGPAPGNPGVLLGLVLGAAHDDGRDKLTLLASPGIAGIGAWIEQLVAESTGKAGRGIVPVDGEPLGDPSVYGDDRVFVQLRLSGDADAGQDAALDALARAGRPVIRIEVGDPLDLGGQFFLWEFATAVAGAAIGVNPFDQPDVEAAKVRTRELTAEYERTGSLPPPLPAASPDQVAAALGGLGPGDYLALLAFVPRTSEHRRRLDAIRATLRDRTRAATTAGFGPRYLHSTGQAHKGGPPRGVFVQLTCEDVQDVPVPGRKYTFGVVKAAQAQGDLDVLAQRGRRVLRVHLGADVDAGLAALEQNLKRA